MIAGKPQLTQSCMKTLVMIWWTFTCGGGQRLREQERRSRLQQYVELLRPSDSVKVDVALQNSYLAFIYHYGIHSQGARGQIQGRRCDDVLSNGKLEVFTIHNLQEAFPAVDFRRPKKVVDVKSSRLD